MGKPNKILCVAGDAMDRQAIFEGIQCSGVPCEVTAAKSVSEARDCLAEAPFDAVVADYHLADGVSAELLDGREQVPFVFLGATSLEELALRARGRETDDYLPKDAKERYLEILPLALKKALRCKVRERTDREDGSQDGHDAELRRLAEEAGEVGSFHYNIQTGEARVSPELLSIYGEEPGSIEPTADAWLNRVHPDDHGNIAAAIQAFRPNGPSWSCEYRIIRPSGEIRWVEARARTLFDSQGQPAHVIGVNLDITDRKKSQEELRESEIFHRTLIETLPVTIVLADTQGKVTYISPAAKEMFGLEPGEGLDTRPTDWIAPEHHDTVRQRMRKVMVDLRPQPPIEYRMFRRDRTPIWASVSSSPLLDARGKLSGVITVCENITDRKVAEEAMREREERLRMVLQASATGWWVWDVAANRVTADAQAKALFGVPSEKVAGFDSFLDVLDADEIQRILEKMPAVLSANDDFQCVFNLTWPDGSPHCVQAKGRAFRDAAGQNQRLMGIVVDITAQQRAEKGLQRAVERFELLFEVASKLLAHPKPQKLVEPLCQRITEHLDCDVYFNYLFDEQEHRLHLNACGGIPADAARAFEWLDLGQALCGYAARERIPIIVEDLQHGVDPRAAGLRALGITAYACHPLISRDDLIGTLSFASRRKLGFNSDELALMQAVSDQVAVAIERRQLMEWARRSAAEAEAANRAKDRFLAVLSHELRTPLTPVVMGLSMLQDCPDLDPQVRETLETLRSNAEMEARLIDDLLDITRIARGKIELHGSTVELGAVIRRAIEVCMPDIEARGLDFGLDLGPAPYWVQGDAARLQQVFWNLLKNAVKFTPHRGCVQVRCEQEQEYVVAEVNDSGIGIEAEALPHVFDAFEQAERSITRQFGGLGLGLTISKALMEMHGGTIEAISAGRNCGATFRIRLPLSAPAARAESPVPAPSPNLHAHPLHILLVEDHGVTAKMTAKVLVVEGHTVEMAADVAAALSLAGQQEFDLLLSDLGLPDGSGHELMRQLRANGHRFPGIALSGYGREDDVRRSYEAGFSAHLTKPASREAILQAVASVAAAGDASQERRSVEQVRR